MKGVLIDLDGVLYEGDRAVAGAAQTVSWLARESIPHLFLTNTTSCARAELVHRLASFGVHTIESRILTPPVAASAWLADHAPGPTALFVPAATRADLHAARVLPEDAEEGAASVVVGDLGEGWDFATLNRAFRLLMAEPRPVLVALGMTRYWQASDGLRLDVAPFIKALEHTVSCQAVVLGKPSPAFFEAALEALGCAGAECVMVGDDVIGDVQGSQLAGLTGVLVRTGKFREQDLAGAVRPDAVLDSIADLEGWWSIHA
jgi:HAD superfamily hydrolase (TIGR01458 family)